MKSTIIKAKKENTKPKYPYLARFKGESLGSEIDGTLTVLFVGESRGTVVYSKNVNYPIGTYLSDWAMEHFFSIPDGTQIILEQ